VTAAPDPFDRRDPTMKTRAILTVLGADRVGIVAAVAAALAATGTNIEDIRQTIIDEVFSMTMLVTVDEDATTLASVQERLATVAADLGVQITLQREDVFRAMHRI
jgi:ACT domain-containing protein